MEFDQIRATPQWSSAVSGRSDGHLADIDDSLWCAIVAARFHSDRSSLVEAPPEASIAEGWIWVPMDFSAEASQDEL